MFRENLGFEPLGCAREEAVAAVSMHYLTRLWLRTVRRGTNRTSNISLKVELGLKSVTARPPQISCEKPLVELMSKA